MPLFRKNKFPLPDTLHGQSTEDAIGVYIDLFRNERTASKYLVPLLEESHPVYEGRSQYAIARIRGYLFAAMETTVITPAGLAFIADELQNGRHAYSTAGAAKALRAVKTLAPECFEWLQRAILNIRGHDDIICFDAINPQRPFQHPTTALQELFVTYAHFGGAAKAALPVLQAFYEDPYGDFNKQTKEGIAAAITRITNSEAMPTADCCDGFAEYKFSNTMAGTSYAVKRKMKHVKLEDQSARQYSWKELTEKKITAVAFFYTRCNNPNKCSLTVSKLSYLQQAIRQRGLTDKVQVLGISYDPDYDTCNRLQEYGRQRGMEFTGEAKLLRASEGYDTLKKYFALQVGYSSSIVNHHAVELFLLNEEGTVIQSFSRTDWDIETVAAAMETAAMQPVKRPSLVKRTVSAMGLALVSMLNALVPIVVAFFPKCPICWAVYMSAFGIGGLQSLPYSPWLKPVFIALMVINLVVLYIRGKRRKMYLPLYLSIAGSALVLLRMQYDQPLFTYVGMALLLVSSLLNSFDFRKIFTGRQHWRPGLSH
ncbi:MAG: SCO family protein [Bacteroidetes bacterium]|nr:SCO family protein [Bacteroidota bacterium]